MIATVLLDKLKQNYQRYQAYNKVRQIFHVGTTELMIPSGSAVAWPYESTNQRYASYIQFRTSDCRLENGPIQFRQYILYIKNIGKPTGYLKSSIDLMCISFS